MQLNLIISTVIMIFTCYLLFTVRPLY